VINILIFVQNLKGGNFMSKNRSTWAALLSIVLAMVVMAGMAVTSFAETESLTPSGTLVEDPAALEAVLNGGELAEGVNYDADGNGIVEWADLDALNGTQVDLLPDGTEDMLSLPLYEEYTILPGTTALQQMIVRGDSTTALRYDSNQGVELTLVDPVDFSGHVYFKFDMFCPDGVDTFNLVLLCGADNVKMIIQIEVTNNGWTPYSVDLTKLDAALLAEV